VTASAKKILDEALNLPKEEREGLIEALAESLDLSPTELSPEWQREVSGRIAQIERGDVKTAPWTEVQARVDASLKSE
jgi:putative addiction module component (TIGR02574 family)